MKSFFFLGHPPPPPPPAYTAGGKLIDSKLSVKESYSFSYSC